MFGSVFNFGDVFVSVFDTGDVLWSTFVIGDVHGLYKNRLLSLKHYLFATCQGVCLISVTCLEVSLILVMCLGV